MSLYVTPRGTWAGTEAEARKACKAEGSKSGAFKKVDTPKDKAAWLRLLNGAKVRAPRPGEVTSEITGQGSGWISGRMVMHGENQQQLPKEQPVPEHRGPRRYRVYCRGLFVGATPARNPEQAIANIVAQCEARLDKSTAPLALDKSATGLVSTD